MELLLILSYAAISYAVFKIFKIPVNKWTLPAAAFGGVLLLGLIMLVMNYNHPFTKQARIVFVTTPIIPNVTGRVIEVPVASNVELKAGDVLFKIDPRPFEFQVQKQRAVLAEAEQAVGQLRAASSAASAQVSEAVAERDRARQSFERYETGNENARRANRPLPFPEIEVENRRGVYLASESAREAALAKAEQAQLAFQSQIDGVNTSVARIRADLDTAEFNLDQTVVRAPGKGYVTQVGLRPGMMAVSLPLRPVMTFVHLDDTAFTAAFLQNSLQRVRPGDEAEIAFDAVPGRIFKGKVRTVIGAIAAGQFQSGGALIDFSQFRGDGRALAILDVTDDTSAFNIPPGAEAVVAVYTPYWHHFAIIRRILLRMKSWQNFIFLEGH